MSDMVDLGRAKVTGQYQMQVLKKTVLKELKLEVGDYVQFWRDSKNRVWIEKVMKE